MAYETGVMLVNTLKDQLTELARSIVSSLNDKKISPMEGVLLGMKGMNLATSMITLLEDGDTVTRDEVLYVLEHGKVSL